MAWLHSAPKQHPKDENPQSRIQSLPDDHPAKNLPEVDHYLAMCFELSGFCTSGTNGPIPLNWPEVESFSNQSAYTLNGWESEQIIKMSRSYCYMRTKADKLGCPPPYQEGVTEEENIQNIRDRAAKQWEGFSSGYAKKKKG